MSRCPCCGSLPVSEREAVALGYEGIAIEHRARGEFKLASRWDDYARAVRMRGETRGLTSNGQSPGLGEP